MLSCLNQKFSSLSNDFLHFKRNFGLIKKNFVEETVMLTRGEYLSVCLICHSEKIFFDFSKILLEL